jgi:putative NADPH-quinone reductase
MKIYLLLAHPNRESFNGALADAYQRAATAHGHEVRRQDLGELRFDPVLHKGYASIQELEPDLLAAQDNIKWCDRWVIFYPVWWGSVPALFKGFLDRALTPDFAFRYHDSGPLWDKLLQGRSAHIFTTSDAPWWWIAVQYRNSDVNAVKRATLQFCGISPVTVTRIDAMKDATSERRSRALAQVMRSI